MKKLILIILFLTFGISSFAQSIFEYINTASDFFNKLEEGKYKEAQGFFDDSVKEKLAPEMLEKIWTQINSNLGEMESIDGAQNSTQGEYQIVTLNCKFKIDTQPFRFVFNKQQKLMGFYISPKKAADNYKIPVYADTSKVSETLVTIKSGSHDIPAMVTFPKDSINCPVVVFVHGSGPADMDETVGPHKPFKDIALGLASQGIASIRYVKRTALFPQEFDGAFTTKEEVTDDAIAALKFAKKLPSVDSQKVYLFGHSLGGMLAPKIATQYPDIKGIILAAAPARKFQDLSVDQNNYLFKISNDTTIAGKESLEKNIAAINASRTITSTNIKQDSVVLGLPASYWADLNNLDQVSLAKKLKANIFIIQGGNDFQVTDKDFFIWTNALKKKADSKLYPMLNHLLSFVTEKGTTAQYMQPGNVDQPLIDDLASWILMK